MASEVLEDDIEARLKPAPHKYSMLFNVATGVAIGSVIGFLAGRMEPQPARAIGEVVTKSLGLRHTDFSAPLSGIVTLGAVGGVGGGVLGAVKNAWDPQDRA